jgi:hypothetical protein
MAAKIIYPEMLEYPWVKDLDRVRANSKFVSGSSEKLPVPINFLLTVMREAISRPEVMQAYGSAPLNGTIPPREQHLLLWYHEYLRHKYGVRLNPAATMIIPMRKLANGIYSGLDDTNLVADLLARPDVCEDDGVNYDQEPPAG